MKRGCIDHPKTRKLMRLLNLKRYQAVGILEAMWHYTAQYAKQGDVGRVGIEEMAEWIEWPSEQTDELAKALVECGWLDIHPDKSIGYVVHDWDEHCDDTTKKYLARAGLRFIAANAQQNPMSGNVQTCPDISRPPEPEPEPEPAHGVRVPHFSKLRELGVSEQRAEWAVVNFSETEVQDAITVMAETLLKEGIRKPNAFLKTLLEDGVTKPMAKPKPPTKSPEERAADEEKRQKALAEQLKRDKAYRDEQAKRYATQSAGP